MLPTQMKHFWSHYLLIAASLFSDIVKGHPRLNKRACSFLSNRYELETANKVQFGKKCPPLEVTEYELENLFFNCHFYLTRGTQIPLNTVDNFIRFYSNFKISGKTIENFYDNYTVKYVRQESLVGRLLYIMDFLEPVQSVSINHEIGDSMYLCGAHTHATTLDLQNLNQASRRNEIPILSHFDLAVGVIEVKVKGKKGQKDVKAYIVMDPGYLLFEPFIVKEDGSEFFTGIERKEKSQKYKFGVLQDNSDYIYVAPSTVDVYKEDGIAHPVSLLIYVGKPYCSFLETTEKPSLFDPERVLFLLDENGDPWNGFSFNARYDANPKLSILYKDESDEKSVLVKKEIVSFEFLKKLDVANSLNEEESKVKLTLSKIAQAFDSNLKIEDYFVLEKEQDTASSSNVNETVTLNSQTTNSSENKEATKVEKASVKSNEEMKELDSPETSWLQLLKEIKTILTTDRTLLDDIRNFDLKKHLSTKMDNKIRSKATHLFEKLKSHH